MSRSSAPEAPSGGAHAAQPVLIGVDWGTSSARAYAFAADGAVVGDSSGPWGIQKLGGLGYAEALARLCAPWRSTLPGTPVIACGMVGSRQGWREAPYLGCPASPEQIAGSLVEIPSEAARIALVPGLSWRGAQGAFDVMRGEETQVAGLDSVGDRVVVMPGTHSKWVTAPHGCIEAFATFMTGEVYAVLHAHSILGRLAQPNGGDAGAFAAGVDRALAGGERGAGLLHDLFSARAGVLAGQLRPEGVADYLSGLLIGSEIAGGKRRFETASGVLLVGEAMLCARYAEAFARASTPASIADPGTTARGLWRIATLAGLVAPRTPGARAFPTEGAE